MKPWLVPVLFVGALLVLWFARGPRGPIKDPQRDAHLDSSAVIQKAAADAIARADSVEAREKRHDLEDAEKDAERIALGRRLDSLDRLVARRQREKLAAFRGRDSALALVDSMTGNIAPDVLDTVTVPTEIAGDTALSCESRYEGRLLQLSMLGEALERCRSRGDTVRSALVGLRDTTALLRTYAAASDSLLKWERDRPRPCKVSLGVASVSCGTAMGGTALLGLLGGIFVGR